MTRSHSITLPDGLSDKLQARSIAEARSLSSLISFLVEAKLREIEYVEAINRHANSNENMPK
jgi:predicted DNA-binding protein